MLGLLIGTIHLLLILNATVRSVAAKWVIGSFAGIGRTFLLMAIAIAGARIRIGAVPTPAMNVGLYAGPVLTLAVFALAFRRRRTMEAGSEAALNAETISRAWLAAAVMDGLFAIVNLARTMLA